MRIPQRAENNPLEFSFLLTSGFSLIILGLGNHPKNKESVNVDILRFHLVFVIHGEHVWMPLKQRKNLSAMPGKFTIPLS